jgi:hypothetical protein
VDVNFYIVDISVNDLKLIKQIFYKKYNITDENIIPIKLIDLYKLKLDKTLVLDIHTFYNTKEFLTNEIHCFSNESHEMFRYQNDRQVTYYGSYYYQNFDKFCYLKLNFEIFKPITFANNSVFISSRNLKYLNDNLDRWKSKFPDKKILIKKIHDGFGDLFEMIDSVHYVHLEEDTNNRIIPESFYYNKKVTIEHITDVIDSVNYRYDDIMKNGLINYTLTEDDEMIKSCLKY